MYACIVLFSSWTLIMAGCKSTQYYDGSSCKSCPANSEVICDGATVTVWYKAKVCGTCGTNGHTCNGQLYCSCKPGTVMSNTWECEVCGVGVVNTVWGLYSSTCSQQCAQHTIESTDKDACIDCEPNAYSLESDGNVCKYCSAGKYLIDRAVINAAKCVDCNHGHYSNYGAISCIKCDPGRVSAAGAAGCSDCARGQIANGEQSGCDTCAAGKFSNFYGGPNYAASNTLCIDCPVGQYNDKQGLHDLVFEWGDGYGPSCLPCEKGKYNDVTGATVCKECEAGKFQNWIEMTLCDACPPGKYQGSTGKSYCDTCAACNDGLLVGCTMHSSGTCHPCNAGVFSKAYPSSMTCVNFAKLQLVNGELRVAGYDLITSYLTNTNGEQIQVQSDEYLTITDANAYAIKSCAWCGIYEYVVGCGKLQNINSNDIAIKLGNEINLVSEWTTVIGRKKSDLVFDDFNSQQAMIVRSGKCFPCEQCTSGYFLRDCKDRTQRGNCFMCRRECNANQYLTHRNIMGCINHYDETGTSIITNYISTEDYTCSDCLNAHYQHGAYELLVGCAGVGSFTRWHPRAETDADRDKLLAVTCEFDAATGLGAAGDEACYHGGRRLWKSVGAVYPAGQTLRDQNWTSTMPYCPPGWRVDADKFDVSSVWQPDACVRCTECGTRRRASHWRRCSGQFTQDTQNACADSCNVGEYMNAGVCKACQKC